MLHGRRNTFPLWVGLVETDSITLRPTAAASAATEKQNDKCDQDGRSCNGTYHNARNVAAGQSIAGAGASSRAGCHDWL
jgi:hypothetical protein